MQWNSDKTSYISKGKKVFVKGDHLPAAVVAQMGSKTLKEYVDNGFIIEAKSDDKRLVLLEKAKELGLKPHHKAGIEKIQVMIDDHVALQNLKKEALFLGIDPSDDVKFDELKTLVDEKKDELDNKE